MSQAGELYVSDTERQLQVFRPDSGGVFRYLRSIHLGLEGQSICFLNGSLIVQGLSAEDQALIHLYDLQGSQVRSFGHLYSSPNVSLNEELGYGQIACDEERETIYYAPSTAIGEVRAYSAQGHLEWRAKFSGYRSNEITDMPDMGYRVAVSPDGAHSLIGLSILPGKGLLVQWTYRTLQELKDREAYGSVISFLLNPETGAPLPLGNDLPPIRAVGSAVALVGLEDPAPRFEVRPLR